MHLEANRTHCYDDIITLPHRTSASRLPMSRSGRAAQFAPFAALTGHEAAIRETARLTEPRVEPDEEYIALLNRRLRYLWIHRNEHPVIAISYFMPDSKKQGGSYINVAGALVKFNHYTSELVLEPHTPISIQQIRTLESPLFDSLDPTP